MLGVILLTLIMAGWFLPTLGISVPGLEMASPAESSQALFSTLDAVAGQGVLVAFDYSPAMGGELDAVAEKAIVTSFMCFRAAVLYCRMALAASYTELYNT